MAHNHRVKGAAMEVYGTMCRTFKWICKRIVSNYTSVHPVTGQTRNVSVREEVYCGSYKYKRVTRRDTQECHTRE